MNEGVASVNDEKTKEAMAVLRYELETFVCDGQYAKGLEAILDAFLTNLSAAQQKGVWISGFYGSGKSHLVKMLRALWVDTAFEDGTHARTIAHLPKEISDLLKELSKQGKINGGLHAASGTLGSGASGSVRLALLGIIFKSVNLPEQYPQARFVMWLREQKIYEKVREDVEKNGYDWEEELQNFYVAEGLQAALMRIKPNPFSNPSICVETLNNIYPYVTDVSSDDMIKAIRAALSKNDEFPLTLIVLDEVQSFIGDDGQRSSDVQEAVEACCKNIGSKLLFIGTGQTAISGTPNLKKLEGRFTIRGELSDADVDAVIRKVILAKKPSAIAQIDKVMRTNLGEISRHLSNTTLAHRQDDMNYFAQDYPVLPVRRRFWENTLRVLDPTGTDSQLRNQLSMIHKAIQTNLDEPIGHIIPADYLYFDAANRMLQSRILPRKVYEKTMKWITGSDDEKLLARACGLIFLINKLNSYNKEIGIKATVDTLADLMVEDLAEGSAKLRSKLPELLNKCDILMKIDTEYRIQTEESAAWSDEFANQRSTLGSESYRIDARRDDLIKRKCSEILKNLTLSQGISKESREISQVFASQLPTDYERKVCVWIRDGWSIDENSVRAEARRQGNESPTIFVYLPKRSADALRHNIIEFIAAENTLGLRGNPNNAEGIEARSAIETAKQTAEAKIDELLNEMISGARVFQSGGNEITGSDLRLAILDAAKNSLQRLYPEFHVADQEGWDKVYNRAKQGSPDALKAIGFNDDPKDQEVCKKILNYIGGGKKGSEIISHFENAEFGWPGDAIDGALQVLLIARYVKALDPRGKTIDPKELERRAMRQATFKVESPPIKPKQLIELRKLYQMVEIRVTHGEEAPKAPLFLEALIDLAHNAGGDSPKPEVPDVTLVRELQGTGGNEQLSAIHNNYDELSKKIEEWTALREKIDERLPIWNTLQALLHAKDAIKEADEYQLQADAILHQRLLLAEPDLVLPLVKKLEDAIRKEFIDQYQRYNDTLKTGLANLDKSQTWNEVPAAKREAILKQAEIGSSYDFKVGDLLGLLAVVEQNPLQTWSYKTDALSGRFSRAQELAAKELEPKTQSIDLPKRLLKTNADVEAWIKEVKEQLKEAVKKGPVVLR